MQQTLMDGGGPSCGSMGFAKSCPKYNTNILGLNMVASAYFVCVMDYGSGRLFGSLLELPSPPSTNTQLKHLTG